MGDSLEDPLSDAERLIQEEFARLVTYDTMAYPPVGSKIAGNKHNAVPLEDLSDDYLALARGEVDLEMSGPDSKEKYEAFTAEFDQVWVQIQQDMKELQQIGLATQFSVSYSMSSRVPFFLGNVSG